MSTKLRKRLIASCVLSLQLIYKLVTQGWQTSPEMILYSLGEIFSDLQSLYEVWNYIKPYMTMYRIELTMLIKRLKSLIK